MEDIPCWLNETFLSSVLQGAHVTRYSTSVAGDSGNNYYSRLYRVCVLYNRTTEGECRCVLLIKAPLEQGFVAGIKNSEFYNKEPLVYELLLPRMKEITNCEFGPQSFLCPRKNTLVLADLTEDGYVMLDKFDQLDFPHCKIVLESLAKFHATSVVCCNKNPELIQQVAIEEAYRSDGLSVVGSPNWMKLCVKQFADIVSKLDVLTTTKEFVNSRVEDIWETAISMSKPSTNSLNVLNHGDCWTNNILFKHNQSGTVIDVKFVDFQFVRFASPVLDLVTFLYSSANQDVRQNKQEELYSIYLKCLNETFYQLGCEERFTREDLQRAMKAYLEWILIVISFDIPFFLSKSEDAINFDEFAVDELANFLSDPETKRLHNGTFYRELLPSLMKMFEKLLYSE